MQQSAQANGLKCPIKVQETEPRVLSTSNVNSQSTWPTSPWTWSPPGLQLHQHLHSHHVTTTNGRPQGRALSASPLGIPVFIAAETLLLMPTFQGPVEGQVTSRSSPFQSWHPWPLGARRASPAPVRGQCLAHREKCPALGEGCKIKEDLTTQSYLAQPFGKAIQHKESEALKLFILWSI